jgi:excinuclease UvrABC nuclease subunit
MYTDDYGRSWHGPYPFTHAAVAAHAPNRMGVYQIMYSDVSGAQVAYIGIATGDTIHGRLRKHLTGSGNWALAQLGDPTKFQFVYYECDELTAKQIESHVITMKKPPFNTKPEYKHFIHSIAVH